ncbi:hypothetical protein LY78DRAFT_669582 [Colletotrichum sublineola]|nr:hypothetical protein LY78DRAFT_669582 [Colletotrichum sublineola]
MYIQYNLLGKSMGQDMGPKKNEKTRGRGRSEQGPPEKEGGKGKGKGREGKGRGGGRAAPERRRGRGGRREGGREVWEVTGWGALAAFWTLGPQAFFFWVVTGAGGVRQDRIPGVLDVSGDGISVPTEAKNRMCVCLFHRTPLHSTPQRASPKRDIKSNELFCRTSDQKVLPFVA